MVDPSVAVVGGVQEISAVPAPADGSTTVIAKGESDAVALPSVALIVIFEYVPASAVGGVPESWPVLLLKLAQAGPFTTENVIGPWSLLVADGVKLYCCPAVTAVAGTPEMLTLVDFDVAGLAELEVLVCELLLVVARALGELALEALGDTDDDEPFPQPESKRIAAARPPVTLTNRIPYFLPGDPEPDSPVTAEANQPRTNASGSSA
jgi:hypothetical protein